MKDRADVALENPFLLAAYIMDHRYQGAGLSPNQICESDRREASAAFCAYLAKEDPFTPELSGIHNYLLNIDFPQPFM